MATLDISVVNIALPTLSRRFGVPITTIEWVVLAYVLTIAGLLLALGRLADRHGRRRIYGLGLIVFTLGSAACAAASSAAALIGARTFQGLGAAMMTANSTALLVVCFPPEERGKALGAFGAMVGVGLGLGPPLGGALIEHLSWRWIFLINLPLGVLALSMLRRRVPPDSADRAAPPLPRASAAAWCAGLVLLMLGLSRGPEIGWGVRGAGLFFAGAGVFLLAFALIERSVDHPLLPVADLKGALGATATLTLLGNLLSIAVAFHVPFFLQEMMGFEPARSGRWLAVVPAMALVLAPIAGAGSDRWGARTLSILGFLITALGLGLLARLGLSPGAIHLIAGMALIGIGQGLFAVPNARAVMSSVPPERLGVASGLQGTMRNLGISGGAALTAALMASRFAAHGGGTLVASGLLPGPGRAAFASATADTYLVLTVVALVGAALATRSGRAAARASAA